MVACTATVITLRAAAQSQGSGAPLFLPRTTVLTDKDAYFLLPPDVVAGPHLGNMTVSPNKDYLLVERIVTPPIRDPFGEKAQPKQVELSLILWSTASRQASVVWKRTILPPQITDFPQVNWLEGTATALLQEMPSGSEAERDNGKNITKGRLLLLDARQGPSRVLASELDPEAILTVSGQQPLASLYSRDTNTLRLIGPAGFQGTPVAVRGSLGKRPSFYWRTEGKTLSAMYLATSPTDAKKQSRHYALVNVATGEVTEESETVARAALKELFKSVKTAAGPPLPPLKFKKSEVTLKEGDSKAVVHSLWLEGKAASDTGRIFVAPDAENYSDVLARLQNQEPGLLPDAVLYKANGALFAAPLLSMSKTAYLKKRQDALRQIALQNGKQIALSLLMYSQDYDGQLPVTGGNLPEMVGPYLKNDTVFQDPETGGMSFTRAYTDTALGRYVNGNQIGILGYIAAPGGRAVIYADGRVLWEPSPAP